MWAGSSANRRRGRPLDLTASSVIPLIQLQTVKRFSWLHLSDLHFGAEPASWLWPNVREAFFKDLAVVHDQCGPWNAILFTGDLTQSGSDKQFAALEDEVLGPLWDQLHRLGSKDALLLAVPGNHDLVRPDFQRPSAAVRQMLENDRFREIEEEFWNEPTGEYRGVVNLAFSNYARWWSKTALRPRVLQEGLLPGDFSTTVEIGGPEKPLKVGVLGLNTAFLQLSPNNAPGSLELHARQAHAASGNDLPNWIRRHDFCILLTHHGQQWLSVKSTKEGYQEINPAGRFVLHFFGHMHDNVIRARTSAGGGAFLREWQSASLFGMEKFGEPPSILRRHGYAAGEIQLQSNIIRHWPRKAVKDENGWRFVRDEESCVLEGDGGTLEPVTSVVVPSAREPKAPTLSSLTKTDIAEAVGAAVIHELNKLPTGGAFAAKLDQITVQVNVNISVNVLAGDSLPDDACAAEIEHGKQLLFQHFPNKARDTYEFLRKERWNQLSKIGKFRVLTNAGAAYLMLGEPGTASSLFLEALDYNPEDQKAICNASLASLLRGNVDEAKKYARAALSSDPKNSRAHSLLIQASANIAELEETLSAVPVDLLDSLDIAFALGQEYRRYNRFQTARDWLSRAERVAPQDIDVLGALAETLLQMAIERKPQPSDPTADQLDEMLVESVRLFTTVLERIRNTELFPLKHSWLLNRSTAKRLIGDLVGAIEDAELTLALEPDNVFFHKQRALLAYEQGDFELARIHLLKIFTADDEAALLLADLYRPLRNLQESKTIVEQVIGHAADPILSHARRLLIEICIEMGKLSEAEGHSDRLLENQLTAMIGHLMKARIKREAGKSTEVAFHIEAAKALFTIDTSREDTFLLADELYREGSYLEAARMFAGVVNPNIDTPAIRKLLDCYYKSGQIRPVLDITRGLIDKQRASQAVIELAMIVYEDIGDLTSARDVCLTFLAKQPKDLRILLRLAAVHYRMGEYQEVDQYLDARQDIKDLPLALQLQRSYLLVRRGRHKEALETIYQIRRIFYGEPEAHLRYVGMFVRCEQDGAWLKRSVVTNDCSVCLEDSDGSRSWYTIEQEGETSILAGEIRPNDPLAKELLGKLVGDIFSVVETPLKKRNLKIIDLQSKYVHAFQTTLSDFGRLFPTNANLMKLDMGVPADLRQILQNNEHILRQKEELVLNAYKRAQITLGQLAASAEKNPVQILDFVTRTSDLAVRCALGTEEEMKAVRAAVQKPAVRLVADILALLTMEKLQLKQLVLAAYGKPIISQTSLDILDERISELEVYQHKGEAFIAMNGNQPVMYPVSAEDVSKTILELKSLHSWMLHNCEVVPCTAALTLDPQRRTRLRAVWQREFADTALIASQSTDFLLYSEDVVFRTMAKSELNVDGIWTQPMLNDCLEKGRINLTECQDAIITLIHLKYYQLSIGADILFRAAELSRWMPDSQLDEIMGRIRVPTSDASALSVTTLFLFRLAGEVLVPGLHAQALAFQVLDNLVFGREARRTIQMLQNYVNDRSRTLWQPATEIVHSWIQDWWSRPRILSH